MAAFDDRPRAALLGAGALLVLLALVPWTTGASGLRFLSDVLAEPELVAAGGVLQSALLLRIALAWLPLAGLTLLALAMRPAAAERVAGPVALALAVPPLVLLFTANPTFVVDPHAGAWDRFAGLPLSLGALAAAVGLHTLRVAPTSRAARVVAGLGATFIVTATLMPWYEVGEWHLPLWTYVRALAAGTVGGAAVGLVSLALLVGAILALAALPSGARSRALVRPALLVLALAYPVWLALLGADAAVAENATAAPALPRFLVALATLALAVGALVGGRRVLLQADADGGFDEPGWAHVRRFGLGTLEALAVVTAFLLYALLKTHGMGPSDGDENIYFYGASLMTRGVMPYRDFFFAHPPLHLVVPAALFEVFGFHLTLAKAIPAVATGITGAFVFAMGRRHFGRFAGFVSLVAFLFANETLKASTNMTGVNLTTMWLTAGLWAALGRRFLTAGVLLALAIGTGFYAIAGALALVAMAAFAGRGPFLRIAGAFVAVALAVNGAFYAIGGSAYIDGVYTYHGKKPQKDLVGNILLTIHYHALLTWSFALAPLAALASRRLGLGRAPAAGGLVALLDPRTLWSAEREDTARIVWLVTLALVLEFTMFKELYSFYFLLWFPTLALLLGYAIDVAARALVAALRSTAGPGPLLRHALVGAAAVAAVAAWLPVAISADASLRARPGGDPYGVKDEHARRGEQKEFEWKPCPVLPALEDVVKVLFWHGERVKGSLQPGYAWYLQSKKRYFSTAEEVAQYVREHSAEGETITGASTIAPLIALLSGRDMAALVVDTNTKRFKSGMLTERQFFEDVCRDRVRFVIGAPNSFFAPRTPSNHGTVRESFRPVKQILDPHLLHWRPFPLLLFERTTPDAPQGEAVCRFVD